jgi:hypothetical protein
MPAEIVVPRNRFDRVMMWPFRLLGVTGPDWYLSFSYAVTASIVISYFVRRPIPLGIAIAVISSSYGLKAFLAFLDAKTVTAHEDMQTSLDITAIAKAVLERRASGDHESTQ